MSKLTSPIPSAASVGKGSLGLLRARALGIKPVTRRRKRIAFVLAMLADAVQLGLFPMFVEGAASPAQDTLDIGIAVALIATLGFSVRLVAAFALELVPGIDMFPTWTAVVATIPVRSDDREDDTV